MNAIEAVPAFDDNYIWLLRDGDGAHVVDPGAPDGVLARLRDAGLTLRTILITHHHFDHIGGVEALKAATGCWVIGPANPQIPAIDQRVGDGGHVAVGSYGFDVIAVPGHTLDHIAYFQPARGDQPPLLFCGDTLFAGGCGRIFEGDPPMMHRSLQRLAQLPPATRVFCAHEYTLANLRFARAADPANEALRQREQEALSTRERGEATVPSTIGLECATNPFLRAHLPELRSQLGNNVDTANAEATFAALRAWKDRF
jgi:hydroxyacylglutathione hydrolase